MTTKCCEKHPKDCVCNGSGFIWKDKESSERGEKATFPCPCHKVNQGWETRFEKWTKMVCPVDLEDPKIKKIATSQEDVKDFIRQELSKAGEETKDEIIKMCEEAFLQIAENHVLNASNLNPYKLVLNRQQFWVLVLTELQAKIKDV